MIPRLVILSHVIVASACQVILVDLDVIEHVALFESNHGLGRHVFQADEGIQIREV